MINHLKFLDIQYTEKNYTNTHTDGTARAIKHSIKHKTYDDFISDALAVEIESNTGNILIATLYQPQREDTSQYQIS